MIKTSKGATVGDAPPAGLVPAGAVPANEDKLYLGAPEIALRLFGSDAEKFCRIIYHWRTLPTERRPPFLTEVAGRPAAWEGAIRRSASDKLVGAA